MSITRIESYDPNTGALLSSDISSLDFGGIIRGKHCSQLAVIKPITEGTVTELGLFLENNGSFNNAQFSFLSQQDLATGIQPGDVRVSNHFTQVTGVSDFTASDYGCMLDPTIPGYIWLDILVGLGSTIGAGSVNYRFVFEYN
jgi:hypothetical protein